MATAVAASNNNNGGDGGGGGGGAGSSVEQEMALTVQQQQQQKKQQQLSSDAADHTKVVFDISREALGKLMLYHQHSFAEAMAGLDEALNIHVGFFTKDLVFPMQSPILFRKLDMKRQIRAVLADAAKDVSREIERFTRKWSVQDKPGMPTDDARKLANTDFVESTLGGVVVRYVVHGNKGDTSNEAQEADLHSVPATGCSGNELAQTGVDKTIELPPSTSTLLEEDRSDDNFVTEPPASTPPSPSGQADKEATAPAPPSTSGQVEQAAIAEEFVADALGRNDDHDRSGSSKPPPLSSSDEEGSMSPPPTPPLSSPSASSIIDGSPLASLTEPATVTLVLPPPAIVDDEVVVVDGSTDSRSDADSFYGDDSSTATYKPPPLSSSGEEGSSPAPPTPPLSSPSASSMDEPPLSPGVESPSLTLPPATPPTPLPPLVPPPPPPLPSSPSTFSVNPLGEMFSPPLDQPGVTAVITDILCSKRATNDRRKAVKVLAELESGCLCGESMEWVVRGLRTLKAKRELKRLHGGLVFRGPRYGAPLYKTGNGVRRLLRGVAKKHGAGTRFVVCVSSSSGIATDNVKMVTGVISAPSAQQAPAPAPGAARVAPAIDGNVPGLEDWSTIRGNLDDGCRLWAWVY